MRYNDIHKGIFVSRSSRFIAEIEIGGRVERCHVKNTGRLQELLIPGAHVFVNRVDESHRLTKYELINIRKNNQLINVDSHAPNKVFLEYLQSGQYIAGITHIKPEAKYGGSRFDFYVETAERKIFIEIKGVTLENDGVALFPDAPTERGVKHLHELTGCINDGYEAHVVFVIKMSDVRHFSPNDAIHPAFGEALIAASEAGVKISAVDCIVTPDSLGINAPVPVYY